MLEIFKRTPPWVFVLFAVLLAYGIVQLRTRRLSRGRVMFLPALMMSLSLYGVASAFGVNALPFACWLAGVALSFGASKLLRPRWHATYDAATDGFVVPGSGIPLALMMSIFFARYAITVSIAMTPALAASLLLSGGASLLYGAMSGVFLVRALHMLSARAAPAAAPPARAAS